jgi:hypothetical protein
MRGKRAAVAVLLTLLAALPADAEIVQGILSVRGAEMS